MWPRHVYERDFPVWSNNDNAGSSTRCHVTIVDSYKKPTLSSNNRNPHLPHIKICIICYSLSTSTHCTDFNSRTNCFVTYVSRAQRSRPGFGLPHLQSPKITRRTATYGTDLLDRIDSGASFRGQCISYAIQPLSSSAGNACLPSMARGHLERSSALDRHTVLGPEFLVAICL